MERQAHQAYKETQDLPALRAMMASLALPAQVPQGLPDPLELREEAVALPDLLAPLGLLVLQV